jgi:hypothetical protein
VSDTYAYFWAILPTESQHSIYLLAAQHLGADVCKLQAVIVGDSGHRVDLDVEAFGHSRRYGINERQRVLDFLSNKAGVSTFSSWSLL